MKKVGQVLFEARRKHQLSLETIAEYSKVRVDYLEAIEKNEFEQLPPAVFVKGFLKAYAIRVSLDPETVLALFRRDFKVGKRGEIIPRDFLKPPSKTKWYHTPKFATYLSVFAVLLTVIAFLGYQWWKFQQPPMLQVLSPIEGSSVTKTVPVAGKTAIDAVLYVNANPVSLNASGEFRTEVIFSETGEQTITIQAQDRSGRTSTVERVVVIGE